MFKELGKLHEASKVRVIAIALSSVNDSVDHLRHATMCAEFENEAKKLKWKDLQREFSFVQKYLSDATNCQRIATVALFSKDVGKFS